MASGSATRRLLVASAPVRSHDGEIVSTIEHYFDLDDEAGVAVSRDVDGHHVLRQLPVSVWTTDRDLRYTFVTGQPLPGVTPESGMPIHRLLRLAHTADRGPARPRVRARRRVGRLRARARRPHLPLPGVAAQGSNAAGSTAPSASASTSPSTRATSSGSSSSPVATRSPISTTAGTSRKSSPRRSTPA